jgi:hypothetical protein
MPRGQAVLLAVVLLGSYAYFYQGGGWNQNSRFDLSRALVEHGTVRIDAYADNTGDKAVFEGHTYSDKAPGQALIALPPMAIGIGVVHALGRDPDAIPAVTVLSYLATVWAAALPTVLAALSLAWAAQRLGASAGGATFAALAFGLATPAWAYATLLWGHALAAGCLMLAFAAAIHSRDRPGLAWPGLLVGLTAGWGVVTEYPAAPAALVLALLARRSWRFVALGAWLPVLVLGLYNLAAFGSPLRVGYENVQGFSGLQEGVLGITSPKRTVLQEILFGEFRGLLPLAPVLALAPLGWLRLRRQPAVFAAAGIVAYYLLFNASYFYWDGGFSYGPRHIGAALPFLSFGLAPLWSTARLRPVLIILAGWGAILAGLAVSTSVLLPESVRSPIQDVVWPAFARGDLALNHDLFVLRPEPGVITGGILERGAWNLGQVVGLQGHLSLLPLGVFWVGMAVLGWRLAEARAEPATPAEAFRLPVARPPTLG